LLNCGLTSNYQIIVDRVHHTDTFEVQVEMTPEMFSDTVKNISTREDELVTSMRAMLGISPKVTLVAPRSIARSEGKAVRVIDRRKI
jgi:phenylacetate-CoA ligase